MSRLYPALDVRWSTHPDADQIGRLLAEIDDDRPTAVEERDAGLRIFFTSTVTRNRAAVRLVALEPDLICQPLDVSDDDWAERSQASLGSVRVGRLVIAPPWMADKNDLGCHFPNNEKTTPGVVFTITIQPSMGFGTGHHASTRLCLRLLQELTVAGAEVLDVGTGSGVLALAAAALGAARVVAIDYDEDALASARENIERNGAADIITVRLADVGSGSPDARVVGTGPPAGLFDIVLANLTGATLERHAQSLAMFLRPGGTLLASGYESHEEPHVVRALGTMSLTPTSRAQEDGWVAGTFSRNLPAPHRP